MFGKDKHSVRIVGQADNTHIAVQPHLDGQDILIEDTAVGRRLATTLAAATSNTVTRVQIAGETWLVVPHNQDVDQLLCGLIDALISVRYAHPTLVQLPLFTGGSP